MDNMDTWREVMFAVKQEAETEHIEGRCYQMLVMDSAGEGTMRQWRPHEARICTQMRSLHRFSKDVEKSL